MPRGSILIAFSGKRFINDDYLNCADMQPERGYRFGIADETKKDELAYFVAMLPRHLSADNVLDFSGKDTRICHFVCRAR